MANSAWKNLMLQRMTGGPVSADEAEIISADDAEQLLGEGHAPRESAWSALLANHGVDPDMSEAELIAKLGGESYAAQDPPEQEPMAAPKGMTRRFDGDFVRTPKGIKIIQRNVRYEPDR
jgi:hypothetical protein